MNDSQRNHTSPTGVLRNSLSHLAKDVITLCELQAELLQVDLREWIQRCLASTLMLTAIAAILATASVPLALLGVAYGLVQYAGLSLAASLLIVAAVGLTAAATFAYAAWRLVCREQGSFSRFNVELARNLRWLKQVLSHPTATPDAKP